MKNFILQLNFLLTAMQIAARLLTVTSTMQNGILGLSSFALTNKEVQLAALVICTNLMNHMITTRAIKFSLSEIDLIANTVEIREKTHIKLRLR